MNHSALGKSTHLKTSTAFSAKPYRWPFNDKSCDCFLYDRNSIFLALCGFYRRIEQHLEESKGYLIASPSQRHLFVCGSHEAHESLKAVSHIECLSCTRPSPILCDWSFFVKHHPSSYDRNERRLRFFCVVCCWIKNAKLLQRIYTEKPLTISKKTTSKSEWNEAENEKRKTFAKKVLTFFLRMSTIISTEHESVLITGFVTVRQARPEEKSALITQSFLGCTLFYFGLLFLLHYFYSLKKEPVPR